jgi:hypothetical protein
MPNDFFPVGELQKAIDRGRDMATMIHGGNVYLDRQQNGAMTGIIRIDAELVRRGRRRRWRELVKVGARGEAGVGKRLGELGASGSDHELDAATVRVVALDAQSAIGSGAKPPRQRVEKLQGLGQAQLKLPNPRVLHLVTAIISTNTTTSGCSNSSNCCCRISCGGDGWSCRIVEEEPPVIGEPPPQQV